MVSIIVPVYNEAAVLEDFISYMKKLDLDGESELIFIDGGSSDATHNICKNSSFKVYQSPTKGRSGQMNYGALKAQGDVLYFLHADSLPPLSLIKDIKVNIDKGYSSGCYKLSFEPNHKLLKVYSWFTKFDIDLFRFGDQSLFVEKSAFNVVDGFNEELIVMEDQQIVKDLKRNGRFKIMQGEIITSSRKYLKIGVVKLQMIFALIVIMYYMNIRQEVIVDFYRKQIN
jgi:rSAM/selenodomain-associated transferase 2